MILQILTVLVLIPWLPMCMMSPMGLAAHGAYEKTNIIIGLMLSYPIIIFTLYWFFDVTLFSTPAPTLLKWSLIIAGTPAILIIGNALISLAKSKHTNIVLCPAITIKLTHNGQAAASAKVIQDIRIREDQPTEYISHSDDKGEAYLPAIRQTVRISPMAPLSYEQVIRVSYQDEEFYIWIQRDHPMNSTTPTTALSLTCELTENLKYVVANGISFQSSCKGNGILAQPENK